MLSLFTRFKRSRDRKQAEILVNKGIVLLQGSLQHKALFQFQMAIEINPEIVGEMLSVEFDKAYKRGDDDLALSIGRIVLRIKEKDFELANKLGNSARKLKKYKEANDFYRQAFRINREYDTAIYNLAASMGRVPKYNNDVKQLVDTFAAIKTYILPNYKINSKYIENIILQIREEGQEDESHEKIEPTYVEICDRIRKQIKDLSKQKPSSKQKKAFESQVFNLGLFAMSRKDPKLALKCFLQLKNRNCQLEYLDMVAILAMDMESPSKKLVQDMMVLLGKDKTNRYLNANLGLMFRKQGNRILSYKYLATAALLLEKSDGIYCRLDLIRLADHEMELGNLKKALKIYQTVDIEIDNIDVKSSIGQILLYQSRYSDALPYYHEILKLKPSHTDAKNKLIEIHDYFVEKGDDLFEANKFSTALPYFEKALSAVREPTTVKRTGDCYKAMMEVNKAEELYIEYNKLIRQKEKEDFEAARASYIEEGKSHLEKKNYQNAIECFEKAFELKADKDVFVFLAHIYKIQKRTKDLQILLQRWKERISKEGLSIEEL